MGGRWEDGWMNGWWEDGWVGVCVDGWVEGLRRVSRSMGGRTDRWGSDGLLDGWTEGDGVVGW